MCHSNFVVIRTVVRCSIGLYSHRRSGNGARDVASAAHTHNFKQRVEGELHLVPSLGHFLEWLRGLSAALWDYCKGGM